jgi:hypothetical protein
MRVRSADTRGFGLGRAAARIVAIDVTGMDIQRFVLHKSQSANGKLIKAPVIE